MEVSKVKVLYRAPGVAVIENRYGHPITIRVSPSTNRYGHPILPSDAAIKRARAVNR